MRENALKEVYVFLRNKNTDILEQIEGAYKVVMTEDLQELLTAGSCHLAEEMLTAGKYEKESPATTENGQPAESTYRGILFITDCSQTAEALAVKGVPVLGVLTEANKQASFSGVKYLCEGTEPLEPEYLERVYRRYKKLPWHILETKRCIVRETTEEDVDAFYRIYAEPSITAYMENLFDDREKEIQYVKQYRECIYEFYGFGIWTVLWKETGEIIGRIGLTVREGYEETELGFMLGVPWQKKGLAEEVCSAVLYYGKAALELESVQALVEPGNEASVKLLHKLGFACERSCTDKGKTYDWFHKIL